MQVHRGTYLEPAIKQQQAPHRLCKHPSSFGYCPQPLPSPMTGGWFLVKKVLTFTGLGSHRSTLTPKIRYWGSTGIHITAIRYVQKRSPARAAFLSGEVGAKHNTAACSVAGMVGTHHQGEVRYLSGQQPTIQQGRCKSIWLGFKVGKKTELPEQLHHKRKALQLYINMLCT